MDCKSTIWILLLVTFELEIAFCHNYQKVFDSYNNMTDLEEYPNVCYDYESESCAEHWYREIEQIQRRNGNRIGNVKFMASIDITTKNNNLEIEIVRQYNRISKKLLFKIRKFKWHKFKSSQIRRIFKCLSANIQSKNETVSDMFEKVSQRIRTIYNNGRPCFGYCLAMGESGIVALFGKELDYDKLAGFWKAWRDETGRKIKKLFYERVALKNIGAKENGFSDAESFYLENDFEETNFNETMLRLYDEISPLYMQLHGYVRYCLAKFYPQRFDPRGPIPAHILGNVWSQQWNIIFPILQQCSGRVSKEDLPSEVNYNLRQMSTTEMFEEAERFYTSLGMFKMTPKFWERSVFKQTPGKLIDCHGSASDLSNGEDFRIRMCTNKLITDFTTVHHEMGHIEYFMAYGRLPYELNEGANVGFHEAVGDTISLAVKTPEHLHRIGLIDSVPTLPEFDIDYLMLTALEKVVFIPFALTMDSYMLAVSNGSVPYSQLNQHWWDRILKFQGLMPPVQRSEADFDPGAKYHIAFDVSYSRYFASFILQFQFYEALCQLSGNTRPLHRCDFYGSKLAGRKLLQMLSKGKSQHWRDSLKILTGARDISLKSLLRFFKPLYEWLRETNKRLNIPIGW